MAILGFGRSVLVLILHKRDGIREIPVPLMCHTIEFEQKCGF